MKCRKRFAERPPQYPYLTYVYGKEIGNHILLLKQVDKLMKTFTSHFLFLHITSFPYACICIYLASESQSLTFKCKEMLNTSVYPVKRFYHYLRKIFMTLTHVVHMSNIFFRSWMLIRIIESVKPI